MTTFTLTLRLGRARLTRRLLAIGLPAVLALSACGSGNGEADSPAAAGLSAESEFSPGDRPAAALAAAQPEPAAQPTDHAARTTSGLYLRRAAAEQWDRELGGRVVWIEVGCCAGEAADLAILVAFGIQAAKDLHNDAPFLVTGGDLRLAAQVVNRLVGQGPDRVFLVLP